MKKMVFFFFVLLILVGCSSNEKTIEVVDVLDDAEKREEVREAMNNNNDIYSGTAILVDDQLLVAVQSKPWLDFRKEKIEQDLQTQLEEQYPDLNVLVSADFKLYWEANKLVNEEDKQKVSERVEKLKNLVKEET
ncbi:hypothetical protein D7X33_36845 [Butyricicoccus sp. 1XD8-22]|nr:hypothetical protein D7X33_36845 [Butyricicoccus sp. 1XD8-22]